MAKLLWNGAAALRLPVGQIQQVMISRNETHESISSSRLLECLFREGQPLMIIRQPALANNSHAIPKKLRDVDHLFMIVAKICFGMYFGRGHDVSME